MPLSFHRLRHNPKIAAALMLMGALFSLSPWGSAAGALVLGVAVALLVGNPYADKTKLYASKLLSWSIIGLGAGMNLVAVGKAGLEGIGVTAVSIALTLALGLALGQWFRSERESSILITVGTAICGGSAIAAIGPVIRAKPQAMTVALGVVFLLNAVALIVFPAIGHYFELSQRQFGLWSALAIHDTSSVVGAGLHYGPEALQTGTVVKLTRALWIVPLTIGCGFFMRGAEGESRVPAKKPWFILGFLLMAAVVTWVPGVQAIGSVIEMAARKLLVLVLFLIGLSLTLATLRAVGFRPLAQGVALWIIVSVSALFLVKYVAL